MTDDELIKITVESFVKEYIKDSKHLFGGIVDSGKQFLDLGLKRYLHKYKEHYSKVKTLLHGHTPINLYDIYFHTKLFINNSSYYNTEKLGNIFLGDRKYVTIIGEAGSGKSTLLRHLFLNAIDTKFAIPILVELRDLNEKYETIEEIVYNVLLEEDIAVNQEVITRLLGKGKFIFFFDGFDEISSKVKTNAIDGIKSFVNRYGKNKFILTSRPHADAEYMDQFHNHRIGKLDTLNDIFGFIVKQLSVDTDQRGIADKIIESIKRGDQKYIYSFLTNPLLLSIYILTFQTNSLIPAKKHIFYERVIIALFSEHDSRSKMTLSRERLSNLSQEQIEDILNIFCVHSFFESRYDWRMTYISGKFRTIKSLDSMKNSQFDADKLVKDLSVGLSLWTEDGGTYSFAHRTLQEYYTARFVKNLKSLENQKFYELLIKKYITNREHPYLVSLISFLEEMDTFSYKKNFLLPILTKLKSDFSETNREIQIAYFLDYFGYRLLSHSSVDGRDKLELGKYIPMIEEVRKDLMIKFDDLSQNGQFKQALDDEFSIEEDKWEQLTFLENRSKRKKNDKNLIYSEPLFNILNKEIYPAVEIFINQINYQIQEIELFINATESEQNQILDILGKI